MLTLPTLGWFRVTALACLMAAGAVHAAGPVSGQGTWETTLQPRDMDNDGAADAYYDAVLHLTWLADANYARTTGYPIADALGQMTWPEARSWAATLEVHGITGWQLPRRLDPAVEPASSQLSYLFHVTLANARFNGDDTNTGPFLNWQLDSPTHWSAMYWLADDVSPPGSATGFAMRYMFTTLPPDWDNTCLRCGETASPHHHPGFAWAVRPGDVSAVPQPPALAMLLLGLGVLAAVHPRRKAPPAKSNA
jgi:hypothetical protein